MAKTVVQIELDRPAGPYYAGDVVHATITLQNEKELTVRGASAYLMMREEYQYVRRDAKGHTFRHTDTDESLHSSENLESEGTIPAGLHSYSASLRIPEDAVPGFAGKITKNAWLVKAKFDCPKAFDPEAQVEVPLVVPPPGQKAEPGEHGQERSEEGDLRLWLPRLEWVEGETLEGKVLVR
ncbi:MAG: vacuolar protein sorting-associated family 26 protein, partial [Anaerolineae bacterium]